MGSAFFQKDYYQALGVSREAAADEIKKAYRQLALQFHPDRNPGDQQAEERFKEISEAYGVLIDPEKRKSYDFVSQRSSEDRRRPDFGFTQEEIFRDIFHNPMASEVFSDLSREFARMGFRFDERFFDHIFFGGRGGFWGEIIFKGPGGFQYGSFGKHQEFFRDIDKTFFPSVERIIAPQGLTWKGRFFSWLLRKGIGLLLGRPQPPASGPIIKDDLDTIYALALAREEASLPSTKEVSFRRDGKLEKLAVKIPPGLPDGTLLRLRGKGNTKGGKTGDLYLKVKLR